VLLSKAGSVFEMLVPASVFCLTCPQKYLGCLPQQNIPVLAYNEYLQSIDDTAVNNRQPLSDKAPCVGPGMRNVGRYRCTNVDAAEQHKYKPVVAGKHYECTQHRHTTGVVKLSVSLDSSFQYLPCCYNTMFPYMYGHMAQTLDILVAMVASCSMSSLPP